MSPLQIRKLKHNRQGGSVQCCQHWLGGSSVLGSEDTRPNGQGTFTLCHHPRAQHRAQARVLSSHCSPPGLCRRASGLGGTILRDQLPSIPEKWTGIVCLPAP